MNLFFYLINIIRISTYPTYKTYPNNIYYVTLS